MQTHAQATKSGYAHNATTGPRVVHSLAELRMALDDKARGQRIADMRKRRRMTQQAMAEQLGISYRAYQTWEAGTMPEWPNIEKLAKFFKVKPETLIGESAPGPDDQSQLDRIEQKLDTILAHLGLSDPAELLEQELAEGARTAPERDAEPARGARARQRANR